MPTPTKKVAATLKNIVDNPVMQSIMDRTQPILPIIDKVNSYWTYDLFNRRPSPAFYDDQGQLIRTTNLDLSTFLYALLDRGAVINLPEYKTNRARTHQEGIHVVSDKNRHGKIIGLVGNKNTFNFSIRIIDQNVMSSEETGYPRTYNLTDFYGRWYDGWKTIDFLPSAEENKFLTEYNILQNNKITFSNFVNPERWVSFYGQYYFMTKALIDRLVEEKSFVDSEIKRLKDLGVVLPELVEKEITKYNATTVYKEQSRSIKVNCLQVKIIIPEDTSEYQSVEKTQQALIDLYDKKKKINKALEKFRFVTRTIEYAISDKGFDTFPAWIKDVKWEDGYKETDRARNTWNRLKINQLVPFEKSISLYYRWFERTEKVKV